VGVCVVWLDSDRLAVLSDGGSAILHTHKHVARLL
jgi:hypothetical protein